MRQNIDEDWKTDPRRKLLVKTFGGNERLADGMRVEINWLVLDHKGAPIPMKKFKYVEDYEKWIAAGLGEIKDDVVVIAGTDRYEEFFEKQRENGSKGGRPPKPKETQINPTVTQTKPEKPSSSFSFSFSSSPSFSEEEKTGGARVGAPAAAEASLDGERGPLIAQLSGNSLVDQVLPAIPTELLRGWLDEWEPDSIRKCLLKFATARGTAPIGARQFENQARAWVNRERDLVKRKRPPATRARVPETLLEQLPPTPAEIEAAEKWASAKGLTGAAAAAKGSA